jgi:membrane-bound lytic murein transglycosylase B
MPICNALGDGGVSANRNVGIVPIRLAEKSGNSHKRNMRYFYLCLMLCCAACSGAYANPQPFSEWLDAFKAEAVAEGIPANVVEKALGDATPIAKVIELDRKQPEGTISFSQYRERILSATRISKGRALYAQHLDALKKVQDKTGVPPQFIIALWGTETNFGGYTGTFDTLHSLATLAYDGRRSDFFRKELKAGLRILAQGDIPRTRLKGSWAGAMGHCQFMPSSYHRYAVDGDGDGIKDIWGSLPDVFASIGNYLATEGWSSQVPWGYEVRLPQGMALERDTLYQAKPVHAYAKQGVALTTGEALPHPHAKAYLMHPGEADEGAYMVYDNYHVLLDWNRSRYFATSVGLLADAIAAGGKE